MRKKRYLLKNETGHSTVLETLISVGISITLLAVFFYSANTLYTVQDTPESNLESKTMGIMETMVTSTGQDAAQGSEWQDSGTITSLGLSTNPTVEYGIVTIDETTKKTTINISYSFDANEYGLESTCFLAGTKVVMIDGSYKNIEDVVVGDMVKCYDQMKREIVDSKVTHVFHHHPEEMEEYYLVINNQLRVTPNHLIYSDGGWIEASDLKIGDSLFYPSTAYRVHSIDKVFDQVPTFNIEVEGHHNYFVALDNIDALVHNDDPPIARFKWFDKDGLGTDTTVFFNAEESAGAGFHYWWKIDDGNFVEDVTEPIFHVENDSFEPGQVYLVTLKVGNDGIGWDTVTHTVEVNTVGPEPDPRPWVLTGKELWPEGSFSSYGKDYYIIYTEKGNFGDGRKMYMYEVKRKTSTVKPILDILKIEALISGIQYEVVKSALGLEGEFDGAIMNFNIEVEIEDDPDSPFFFGASDQDASAKEATSRRVLIYDPPIPSPGLNPDIDIHPIYRYGEITVRVFLGGTPP